MILFCVIFVLFKCSIVVKSSHQSNRNVVCGAVLNVIHPQEVHFGSISHSRYSIEFGYLDIWLFFWLFPSHECKITIFTRKTKPHLCRYLLSDHVLQPVTEFTELGVHMDTNQIFIRHTKITTAIAYSVLGFIKRICSNMTNPYARRSVHYTVRRSSMPTSCGIHYTIQVLPQWNRLVLLYISVAVATLFIF